MKPGDRIKLIVSDCHLSAGRFFEGRLNPHEDFNLDDDMCDLFEHFSTGPYGEGVEVELILNGDYLDFLNVPVRGEFEDFITRERADYKCDAILAGHPKVMAAIKRFASQPGKRVTYLIGNHDADLAFPSVREKLIRAWDPEGRFPSPVVTLIHDKDRIEYPEGVEIRHGNQMEAASELDFERPFLKTSDGIEYLNIPWGSFYVLKIINRLKHEREQLDKIRPIKLFLAVGLITDPVFTMKYMFLSGYYFFKSRVLGAWRLRRGLKNMWGILKEEAMLFQDLERPARKILDESPKVKTVIFGHTHRPMDKVYADGKQYINTGTWTKMIDLDWRYGGRQIRRTFALVTLRDGQSRCELRQWSGEHQPHRPFR